MLATVTASLDQTFYSPGSMMTLTVRYTVPPESRVSVHSVLAYLGASVASPPAEALIKKVRASDPARAWTFVSDDGATAIFKAVA